jgi:Family of unknown function (DUF6687)
VTDPRTGDRARYPAPTMDLPIRILDTPPAEPVLSVDGFFEAPGLNLSHWPGNATPAALKHDLSTGIALNFARLPADERRALASGCTALVNNHFDTDGVLAMYAVQRPDEALARAPVMLAAAACGDFFRLPSVEAYALDRILTRMADRERSPLAAELSGLDDLARYERATLASLDLLDGLLDGELEPFADLWRADIERLAEDQGLLARSSLDELVHLDLGVWTLAEPGDPGRHALWSKSEPDRQLVLGPGPAGTTARLMIGTKSFFELVSERAQPRPNLEALAARLNQAEGCAPDDRVRWRHQDPNGASPELWFGCADLEIYAEHAAEYLRPSAQDPLVIKAAVVDAVRATWSFSDDPDDCAENDFYHV